MPGTAAPNATPEAYPTDANGGYAFHRFGSSEAIAWYPAAGFRYMDSFLGAIGKDGRYWSCSCYNDVAYFFGFMSGGVFPFDTNTGRCGGYPVRCIRE